MDRELEIVSPEPRDGFDPDEDDPWQPAVRLLTKPAGEVEPSKPEWLVEGWFLRRALNLIVGRQGAGKTTFAAFVVSCVTTGRKFPGDEDQREPMMAAVLSLEEPDDRVVARLKAAGADLDRVTLFGDVEDIDTDGRPFRRRWELPRDISVLGDAIVQMAIDVVVIDGLGYSISGDSHNYSVVGSALAALSAQADLTGAAIVGLVHPPKGASDPVTAAIGSTAWTAIPRVSIVLGIDPDDPAKRQVTVAKSNYRMPDSGLSFIIRSDDELEVGYVASPRISHVSAEDIMAATATNEERGERAEARDFLRQVLADGPMDANEVTRVSPHSERTLKRARGDIGVLSEPRRNDKGKVTGWTWRLPVDQGANTRGPLPDGGSSGHSGHTQDLYLSFIPEGQESESGPLDGSRPFFERDEF